MTQKVKLNSKQKGLIWFQKKKILSNQTENKPRWNRQFPINPEK